MGKHRAMSLGRRQLLHGLTVAGTAPLVGAYPMSDPMFCSRRSAWQTVRFRGRRIRGRGAAGTWRSFAVIKHLN
jgi:hypothetical protein